MPALYYSLFTTQLFSLISHCQFILNSQPHASLALWMGCGGVCVCVGGNPSWSTPYNFLQRNSPTLQPQIGIMTWHFQDQTRGAHFSSVDFSVIVRSRRGVAFVWNTFFHIYLNVWLWQKEIKSTPTALLAESVWVRWGVTGHWPHSTGQKLEPPGCKELLSSTT